MLNIAGLVKGYSEVAGSVCDLLPWFALVAPSVVVNSDGAFMVGYEYTGLDLESTSGEEWETAIDSVEMALRAFDDHFIVWTYIDKRRRRFTGPSDIPNAVAREAENAWRRSLDNGTLAEIRLFLYVSYQPFGGGLGFFDEVAAEASSQSIGWFSSIGRVLKGRLSRKTGIERLEGKSTTSLLAFEDKLSQFASTAGGLRLRRLFGDELVTSLANRVNIASPRASTLKNGVGPCYLSTLLPVDTMRRQPGGVLSFDGAQRTRYCAALSVKGYPGYVSSQHVEGLMTMPVEFTLVQMFRFIDREKGKQFIEAAESHYRSNVKGPLVQLAERFTDTPSDKVNLGQLQLADDASEALTNLTVEQRDVGYHAMAVLGFGDTAEEAITATKMLSAPLSTAGYGLVREELALVPTFCMNFPGAADAPLRTTLVNTGNLADLMAVRSYHIGDSENRHLTLERGVHSPPLCLLPTSGDVPEQFNLHVGDVGHYMVVGPTGAGKTTLMSLLQIMWTRYWPCRIIVLDKDRSCYIPIRSLGGTYIDLRQESTTRAAMNPLLGAGDPAKRQRVSAWIQFAMRSFSTEELSATNISEIDHAVNLMAEGSPAHMRLTELHNYLSNAELKARLRPWMEGSSLGYLFDHVNDDFRISPVTAIDVGNLLSEENRSIAPAIMAHLFNVIEDQINDTRQPTLIYLEEAWYMLRDPVFEAKFLDWLRTMRKRNTCVGIATQGVGDIRNSGIKDALNENMPTRIFLPNDKAWANAEVYQGFLGLRPDQIDVIRMARRKRDYYVVQGSKARLLDVNLPPRVLALTRSDGAARSAFLRWEQSGDPNWVERYVDEITGTSAS